MVSLININGISIKYSDGKLTIEGLDKVKGKREKDIVMHRDGSNYIIKGDLVGNVEVTGDNVSFTVEGDITGNVVGDCDLKVRGDITGNLVGCNVNRWWKDGYNIWHRKQKT